MNRILSRLLAAALAAPVLALAGCAGTPAAPGTGPSSTADSPSATLSLPLPNAALPDDPELLPGGGLGRRGGLVEGVSIYRRTDGRAFSCGEAVSSVRGGYIVRADHEWTPLSARECEINVAALRTARAEGTLDRIRGRQVWIQGDDGTVVRYCRLSSVDPAVQVGLKAPAGTTLGAIGNSGTIDEVRGTGRDCHLYLEIWPAPDRWLGRGDSPQKARSRLAEFFGAR